MNWKQPLWLASRSPRRREMLEALSIDVRIQPADIDDGALRPGRVSPPVWVLALAYLKARRVADQLRSNGSVRGTVLGADTVCVTDRGAILGQATDVDDARRMLESLRNAEHHTLTGVCMLDLQSSARCFLFDAARVSVGAISDTQLDDYLRSNDWRGKAGAYNLSERIAAGWPIQCDGDPATVMGLPMRRLAPILEGLGRSI